MVDEVGCRFLKSNHTCRVSPPFPSREVKAHVREKTSTYTFTAAALGGHANAREQEGAWGGVPEPWLLCSDRKERATDRRSCADAKMMTRLKEAPDTEVYTAGLRLYKYLRKYKLSTATGSRSVVARGWGPGRKDFKVARENPGRRQAVLAGLHWGIHGPLHTRATRCRQAHLYKAVQKQNGTVTAQSAQGNEGQGLPTAACTPVAQSTVGPRGLHGAGGVHCRVTGQLEASGWSGTVVPTG